MPQKIRGQDAGGCAVLEIDDAELRLFQIGSLAARARLRPSSAVVVDFSAARVLRLAGRRGSAGRSTAMRQLIAGKDYAVRDHLVAF